MLTTRTVTEHKLYIRGGGMQEVIQTNQQHYPQVYTDSIGITVMLREEEHKGGAFITDFLPWHSIDRYVTRIFTEPCAPWEPDLN